MRTMLEHVEDPATMQWVFDRMLVWEHENFPPGSWIDVAMVAEYRKDLEHGRFHVVLAWTQIGDTRHLSGFTSWYDTARGRQSWINNVWVRPEYQKQGIGRRLLVHALDHIRKRGRRPYVLVIENNTSMLSLMDQLRSEGHFNRRKRDEQLDYYGDGAMWWYLEYAKTPTQAGRKIR